MNLIKKLSEWSYPFLIVAGILVGPFGLMAGNPVVAGLGNAMFLAGIFTPMWILKEVTFKDAVVGGTLSATVLYFCFSGDIDGYALAVVIPLLAASICLTRYSGVKLIAKQQQQSRS